MNQIDLFKTNDTNVIPPQRRRVVLIDGDIHYGSLIAEVIKNHPVSFSYYNSLSKFTKEHSSLYDIILLDYHLESMNGVQAAGYLKKFFPKTPVLLISGELLDDCIESWPTNLKAFLPKHIGPSQLVVRAMDLLEQVLLEDLD